MHHPPPPSPEEFITLIKSLTSPKLDNLIANLQQQATSIQSQLEARPDPQLVGWNNKATIALRWVNWRLDTAKKHKQQSPSLPSFSLTFVECARALLAPEQYQLIYNEATAIYNENSASPRINK